MTITVEEVIDQVLALYKVQAEFFETQGFQRIDELRPIYHRKMVEIKDFENANTLMALVLHYEKRLAKLEAESMRMVIMREMVRDVIKEEQTAK